jgi:hypothetical protein
MIIRVGHYRVEVRPFGPGEAAAEDKNGDYDNDTKTVRIDSDIPTEFQAEILIHEVIHALWDFHAWPETMTEEEVCARLAKGLSGLFSANPTLHRILGAALSGKKGIVE